MCVREVATKAIEAVLHRGQKADAELNRYKGSVGVADYALLHSLVYGALRHFYSLEADYSRFCSSKPEPIVQAALLMGTLQLRHMRIPAHAAVAESVEALRHLVPKAIGFVNAVLRKVADSEAPKKLKPYQRSELPRWLYQRWRDQFGADALQQFAVHFASPPPLTLALFVDRSSWIETAAEMGIHATKGSQSPYAVIIEGAVEITSLPGYSEGAFVVMDQAAQSAATALQLKNSDGLVIDLCAAPGGKTALLAHRYPEATIIAVERHARRIPRLLENLKRLQLENVHVLHGDALTLPIAESVADAVMLDAPCSASGILRRHPDAKFLHHVDEIDALASQQRAMLKKAMQLLKTDGELLYAVCSIDRAENEDVTAGFNAVEETRLLPDQLHDGFYHARIIADGKKDG